jgi:hypothetical protein
MNAPRMSPFGCRPSVVVTQPGMGTASRSAAVVHQYGHLRRLGGFRFCQRSPVGSRMLAAPTTCIYGAARSPLYTARFLKAVPRKNCQALWIFLISLEFWRNIMYQMMQLKMHGFWAILYVCLGTFSCSWRTEGGPHGPRLGARHTL